METIITINIKADLDALADSAVKINDDTLITETIIPIIILP